MLRWILLSSASSLSAIGLLTVFKAPTLLTWRLAVVAGEFGWVLIVLTGIVAAASLTLDPGSMQTTTLVLCVLAVGLFSKPLLQARKIAQSLPSQLERAFGSLGTNAAAFSLSRLFFAREKKGEVITRTFSTHSDGLALSLDFYPAQGKTVAPCVLVVHGGGWDSGDRTQFEGMNHRLARCGYAVAAIDYRLVPKFIWPAPRDDVRAAIAYLKTHAGDLGIDATRLVLFGRSAGGQLAEAVAYDQPDPALRGVITFYAPADLNFAWSHTPERDVLDSIGLMRRFMGGSPETAASNFQDASPYRYVSAGSLPTLLLHGRLDALVWHRQNERLAERLTEAGVPHVFLDLPWATHACDFNLHGPAGQLSAYAVEWFLAAVTK